jgi:hypothetical protein
MHDFELLKHGDPLPVGTRGISCSLRAISRHCGAFDASHIFCSFLKFKNILLDLMRWPDITAYGLLFSGLCNQRWILSIAMEIVLLLLPPIYKRIAPPPQNVTLNKNAHSLKL